MKLDDVIALRADLIAAAQEELDAWQQDENGFDERLGEGGVCGDIADGMAHVLAQNDACFARVDTEFDGGHEFIVILLDEGVYSLDIPMRIYETGGGYKWTKIPDVTLQVDHVSLDRVFGPMSEEEFCTEYGLDAPLSDDLGAM